VQEHNLIGKILGNRYRVLREIGSGGMAWVYLAEDIKENNLVAVKVLYPQFGEDLSYIQRFNREAKLASTLTDPHIVRVLDYGADRDIYYLIMEYIEGQNLRDLLEEKGPLSWREALEIIDQLATALEHAHLYGVVHRDIKPQNMMLTDSGLLKVLDFGIARVAALPSLTQSGFVGSPYYVSPEQAMGEETDTRSDIYSSGIVLYELLSGRIPFDAKSPWSIINQHLSSEPPPLNLSHEECPQEVQRLLDGMVAKRPKNRFPNPSALRRAINAVLAGEKIPDSTLDTQPITPPDKQALAESLYQRALRAIESEEWGRAVDLLNQVLNMIPSHKEASENLALAEQKSFLVSLNNAGQRALKNKRWEEAINSFNGIAELEPDNQEAKELLTQAQQALEEENAEQLVITLYHEGLAHFEAQRWDLAIKAFEEVDRLSPDYQDVRQRLAEAEKYANPNLIQKLNMHYSTWWRWGLAAVGVIAIFIAFFIFGNGNPPVAGDNDAKQKLKTLYEEAQLAIENDESQLAVALLDQILKEDPDYADAAELKRELTITPTITPTPEPVPTATLTPTPDPLVPILAQAQEAVELGNWSEALELLNEIKATDAEYEQALVKSLFCDAAVSRGIELLASVSLVADERESVSIALADFEAGAAECPRRTDLSDQAERASAYLEALDTSKNDFDTLIQILTPIVAADPDYAGLNAKNLLYDIHLSRGNNRRDAGEFVGALSDYEAALALKVDDPSEAQTRRAELLLSFGQQASAGQLTPVPLPTSTKVAGAKESGEEAPTPEPVRVRFGSPKMISPENDTVFAGKFSDVYLEWEPVGSLAPDEYYDLTVMHIFADEPTYWGTATKENIIRLNPDDIGVGRAGQDRFYWWITVRKANTAPTANSLDLPTSRQSEGRTFVWVP
jgi:serine/threonine protein kinase